MSVHIPRPVLEGLITPNDYRQLGNLTGPAMPHIGLSCNPFLPILLFPLFFRGKAPTGRGKVQDFHFLDRDAS